MTAGATSEGTTGASSSETTSGTSGGTTSTPTTTTTPTTTPTSTSTSSSTAMTSSDDGSSTDDVIPSCEASGGGRCFYVAPDGDDGDDGSIDAPFASTNPIIDILEPGDYVYFRGGEYGAAAQGQRVEYYGLSEHYSVAEIRRSGAEGSPITFTAYPGELPVLDLYSINPACDPTSLSPCAEDAFHINAADYIRIRGFEIVHGSVVVSRNSRYVWIEDNHVHDLYTDRSNNGLIMLHFAQNVYVRNNRLHDTYSRSIPDGNGGWVFNDAKEHHDAQHNGCITTLSGDYYVGYGNESSGPFEITNNNIHDCPVHLFFKNPQGQLVNGDGVNIWLKDNHFHGAGRLAQNMNAANVLFENNLFEGIAGISQMGSGERYDEGDMLSILNEISARNVELRNNLFTGTPSGITMWGLGFSLANGVFSEEANDQLKFYDNIVMIEGDAALPGELGWNQKGYIFSNSYGGMIDTDPSISKTLSRIDSQDNCFVSDAGEEMAFMKHWFNEFETITGYTYADAKALFGFNGDGDVFSANTDIADYFVDPAKTDYTLLDGSPCAALPNVGLSDPSVFAQ